MRILVTGSRFWTDENILAGALLYAASRADGMEQITVVHGAARGADTIADRVALHYGWGVERHPADWDKHGKAAGAIRNQEMVDAGADICLAFLKQGAANRGTKDCAERAKRAGILVRRHEDCGGGTGAREPRRHGPDSPATGESGLPGGSYVHVPIPADAGISWGNLNLRAP